MAGKYDLAFTFDEKDWSCERFHKQGAMMPEDGLQQIKDSDAILLGAVLVLYWLYDKLVGIDNLKLG